jgi:hypothetical protein
MSVLSVRVARVQRLSLAWLAALRCAGFGSKAERLKARLQKALGRLDGLAVTSPWARDQIVQTRLGLQTILEQVEAMEDQQRTKAG